MNYPKKILIIGRNFHPDGKETASLIAEQIEPYLNRKGASADVVLFKDIIFDISNQATKVINAKDGRDLASYKAVVMTNWFSHASVRKDIAHALGLYFRHNDVTLFNSETVYSRSTSKLSQMMLAAQNEVPIPRTVFCLSLQNLQNYLASVEFVMPFIFKDAQASRGKSNFVLKSLEEIAAHSDSHTEKSPFMAQQLVESDGSDFRFFVVGGKSKVIIKRIGSPDSHLNNTSSGAATEIVDPGNFSKGVMSDVTTMSELLHRELTGIDIMFDKNSGQHYFLEANPIPQIATGSNVEFKLEALADVLAETAEGQ